MFKKALAAAAVLLAAGVVAAGPAAALGNSSGPTSANGNGSTTNVADTVTGGALSPDAALVHGSLDHLCGGVPVKGDVQTLVGVLVPIGVQDVSVLSAPSNQQCAVNGAQHKGDEPGSHLLNGIDALAGNGDSNG